MYARLLAALAVIVIAGCRSPLDGPDEPFRAPAHRPLDEAWPAQSRQTADELDDRACEPIALDETATLREYLAYAALHNPRLEAAFARWQAALQRLPQVRALPDPTFTYGYFIEQVETRVGPQEHRLRIAQTSPWFGTLQLREDIASRAAEADYEEYQAVKLRLFFEVQDAHLERYVLARSIELTRENIELLRQLEQTARARYRVGAVGQADVIRLQVEIEKLADHLRSLEDRRRPLTARLNAALNRPTDADLPWPREIPDHRLDTSDEELLALLRRENPTLRALQKQIEQRRLSAELARKAYYPQMTVGVDWIATGEADMADTPGSGDDPIIVGLTLSVPLWREKYDAGVREALALRHAAAKERLSAANGLIAEAQSVLYHYRDADRQVALYRDTLIPKARQSFEASLGAYQSGTGDFLDLLDAERLLLEFQLAAERARAARLQNLARLDMLVGAEAPRSFGASVAGKETITP
jgi:cobalt-zinc-cadmium efflux system outer membrane protein